MEKLKIPVKILCGKFQIADIFRGLQNHDQYAILYVLYCPTTRILAYIGLIHVSIQSDTVSFRLISVQLALKRTNPPQNWFQCMSDQKEGVINPAKGQSFSGSSFITRRSEVSQSTLKHIIVLETLAHTVNILA